MKMASKGHATRYVREHTWKMNNWDSQAVKRFKDQEGRETKRNSGLDGFPTEEGGEEDERKVLAGGGEKPGKLSCRRRDDKRMAVVQLEGRGLHPGSVFPEGVPIPCKIRSSNSHPQAIFSFRSLFALICSVLPVVV